MPYTLNELLEKETERNPRGDVRSERDAFAAFKQDHDINWQGNYEMDPVNFNARTPDYQRMAPRRSDVAQAGGAYMSSTAYRPQSDPRQGEYGMGGLNTANYAAASYAPTYPQPIYPESAPQQQYGPYPAQQYGEQTDAIPRSLYGYAAAEDAARAREFDAMLASRSMTMGNTNHAAQEAVAAREEDEGRKMRRRLNGRGKVILGLYLAVVVVVITLIAVNAGKINSGKAVVPSASVRAVAEQDAGHISEPYTINSEYDV